MIDDVGKGYREEPELDVANYLTNGRMGTEQSVECRFPDYNVCTVGDPQSCYSVTIDGAQHHTLDPKAREHGCSFWSWNFAIPFAQTDLNYSRS
ncbi:uncharacterized protein YALI1_E06628g [Yarrowia lipolytica]|uniref:Uncharacterized protein n=1 Tax=Yarrowia lipolytica TaxID=4952 RepID=A0A1D8NH96_YARLL|nr:hypothetical protein YALI1_E06628g [Yarrowia lipolytica]